MACNSQCNKYILLVICKAEINSVFFQNSVFLQCSSQNFLMLILFYFQTIICGIIGAIILFNPTF